MNFWTRWILSLVTSLVIVFCTVTFVVSSPQVNQSILAFLYGALIAEIASRIFKVDKAPDDLSSQFKFKEGQKVLVDGKGPFLVAGTCAGYDEKGRFCLGYLISKGTHDETVHIERVTKYETR